MGNRSTILKNHADKKQRGFLYVEAGNNALDTNALAKKCNLIFFVTHWKKCALVSHQIV